MFQSFRSEAVTSSQARHWAFFVLLICFAATFIRFPGEWDNDTLNQHAQILSGQYLDWHPPVFAAFWGGLNAIWNSLTGMLYNGSALIYLAHSIMLWGGLALLLRAARPFFLSFVGEKQVKLVAVLAFLLFFGLFEMVPMTRFIFKDTAMMAAYILSLGLMLNLPKRAAWRLLAVLFCILLLFYGTAVRHNSLFALLPLLLLLLLKALPGVRRLALFPACLAIWGGILIGIHFVNYEVLQAKKEYSMQEIFYLDFWKLNYATKTYDLPPLPAGQSWEPLSKDIFFRFYDDKRVYVNSSFKYIREYYGGEDSIRLRYDFSQEAGSFERLRAAWLDKIKKHPGAYFKIHKKIFMELMRSFSFMGLSGAWYMAAGLLIVISGAALLLRKKMTGKDPTPYLVTLSGLFYVLPYLGAIPAIERRYLFWFFFGCFFGICWLAAQLFVKRRGSCAARAG